MNEKKPNLDRNLMAAISTAKFHNPAAKFVNQPGHWTPDIERQARYGYDLMCKNCGQGYNQHYPWPKLPCPDPTVAPSEFQFRFWQEHGRYPRPWEMAEIEWQSVVENEMLTEWRIETAWQTSGQK